MRQLPYPIAFYSADSFVQTSKLTHLLLTYRQSIFVTVYSHLLRECLRIYAHYTCLPAL